MSTKAAIQAVRADLDKALVDIAKKHGLRDLKTGRGTFTPDGSFTLKVEGIAQGGQSRDEQLYNLLRARMPEFPAIGSPAATFKYGVDMIELTGANSTTTKVFFRKIANGKPYQAPVSLVSMALKAAQKVQA